MIDFGMLPPEVNSGRLYAGPGPAPMLGAAAAWDTVAAELGLAATGYGSVIAELTNAAWTGPSAVSMATAAAPYIGWLDAVAMLAEQTAGQARAAAAAYEAAFAMTVPPAVVLENRILLMTLVATNFFGQNSAAIAATEAQYGEMWAQDAAAMYGYLASSSQASTLNAFKAPPETTSTHAAASQAAAGTQTAASQAGNASQTATGTTSQLTTNSFTQLLQQLSTSSLGANTTTGSELPWPLSLLPTPANNWLGLVPANYKTLIQGTQLQYLTTGIANSAVSMVQQLTFGQGTTAGAGGAWYATPEFAHVGLGGQGAAATAGRAVRIGKLSVPHNWAAATVDDNPDELEELELAEIEDLEALENFGPNAPLAGAVGQPAVSLAHATAHGGAAAATSSNAVLGGVPAGLGGGRGGVNYVHKYGWRYSVVARPPAGG